MKLLLKYTIVLALLMTNNSCEVTGIKKDMVHFDQAFIPVWVYTHQGNSVTAKSAVFYLEFQWQKLRKKYENQVEEEDWTESFRRVNDWLGDAYYAIDSNQPQLAQIQLDHVRYELQTMRRHYQIDYYLDHLFDLQDEVGNLIEIANDDMLCLLDWSEFEMLSTSALQHWRNHRDHPIDYELYEIDLDEQLLLAQYQDDMEIALINFLEVVETADREAVAAESWKLEDAFLSMLRLFGNFEAMHTFYANHE